MEIKNKWIVIGGILFLGLMIFIAFDSARMTEDCNKKGGVYLNRESKCVAGIKEVK